MSSHSAFAVWRVIDCMTREIQVRQLKNAAKIAAYPMSAVETAAGTSTRTARRWAIIVIAFQIPLFQIDGSDSDHEWRMPVEALRLRGTRQSQSPLFQSRISKVGLAGTFSIQSLVDGLN